VFTMRKVASLGSRKNTERSELFQTHLPGSIRVNSSPPRHSLTQLSRCFCSL
jgi:hypothetical protein